MGKSALPVARGRRHRRPRSRVRRGLDRPDPHPQV